MDFIKKQVECEQVHALSTQPPHTMVAQCFSPSYGWFVHVQM
jgi:hypothetical protein